MAVRVNFINQQSAMKHLIHLPTTLFSLSMIAGLLISPAMAGLEEGVAAYQAGNPQLAAKEFRAAAEKGDAECQFNLALMYEQGMGVPKDEKEAVVWYRKSAELGNSNAQFNLGVLYENGRGTAVDFAQANQWYRKAAVQGDPLAMGNLGMLYVRGDGVPANKIAGVALLLRSATLDSSTENHAKQNISSTKGLSVKMVTAAQTLSSEMEKAKDLLVPLDEYLKKPAADAPAKSKEAGD